MNKELADLIFPNINKTVEDYEKIYPKRDLKDGACVTRIAPSPTGFMHIGGFFQSVIDYVLAKHTNGVFMLRIEDTDQKREVEGAVDVIYHSLEVNGLVPDEYEYNKTIGNYGPYVQSERKEIYHAFIKHLIEIGRAYPCFCTKEDLEELRVMQEGKKLRTGYYGKYAKCRNIPTNEAIKRIKDGESYVIRFKSMGDCDETFEFEDLVKGKIIFPQNDLDIPIMKSDNLLPTYHFAHLVDDHLMRTTHVIRGEEWLSSVPIHIELFNAFGFDLPHYIHTPLIMKKDGDIVRKISKRKDPEATMSYYEEKGYPSLAVIESLMTIINSNYEEWHTNNPDKSFVEFEYSPSKMSSSGAFYDLEKLNNISKTIISKMSKNEVYNESLKWANKYSKSLKEMIESNPNYYKSIINIEREQEKPRKDIENYSMIEDLIWYMYNDKFYLKEKTYEWMKINNKEEILNILNDYIDNYYNEKDDKETWFNSVKEMCDKLGYASNMKDYKKNPDNFKGNVADISTVLRVAVTSKSNTPDLYELLKLLGKKEIEKRIELIKNLEF
jgi:glutamyl-tRNA synthetase